MSDNYEQWSQRFILSIGENPYASPLWDNGNSDHDDLAASVPENWKILKRSPWIHYHHDNRTLPNQGWKIHTSTVPEQADLALARDAILTRLNQLINTNATTIQVQDSYQRDFDQLEAQYQQHTNQLEEIQHQINQAHQRRQDIEQAHAYRTNHPELSYTDEAWNTLINHATIHKNGDIEFTLKDSHILKLQNDSSCLSVIYLRIGEAVGV